MFLTSLIVLSMFPFNFDDKSNTAISMDELIRNVQASENLYNSIHVEITSFYDLVDIHKPDIVIKNRTVKKTWTRQGNLVRLQSVENGIKLSGEKIANTELITYDGEKTRIRNNGVVNVKDGKFISESKAFRPHTAILERGYISFPLSILLKGDDAIASCASASTHHDYYHKSTILGYENINDNKCILINIVCTHKKESSNISTFKVWLASNKNYIPIKCHSYNGSIKSDKPIDTQLVTQWREVEPGIWAPIKWTSETIDEYELRKTGKIVPSNKESATVDNIILNPKIEKSKIVDFPLKDGDAYYDINNVGKVVMSGFLKAPESLSSSKSFMTSWLSYLFLVLALLLLVAGGYVYRRS